MKRCGGILLIVGIIILILLIGIVGAGIYFYNFYVFKTVRVCVGDATNTMMPCEITQDCVDYAILLGSEIDLNETVNILDTAPDFIQENFQRALDEIIYCDESCFVRSVRGVNLETSEIETLDSCEDGEIEITADVRGKEALEIWKWMKKEEVFL